MPQKGISFASRFRKRARILTLLLLGSGSVSWTIASRQLLAKLRIGCDNRFLRLVPRSDRHGLGIRKWRRSLRSPFWHISENDYRQSARRRLLHHGDESETQHATS